MRTCVTMMSVILVCLSLAAACCLHAEDMATAAVAERMKTEQIVLHQRDSQRLYAHLLRAIYIYIYIYNTYTL